VVSLIELIQSLPQHCDLIASADVEGWNIVIHTTRPFSESALMPRSEIVIPLAYDPGGINGVDVAWTEALYPGKTQQFIDRAVSYVQSQFSDEGSR
jgi:hypothetical protein